MKHFLPYIIYLLLANHFLKAQTIINNSSTTPGSVSITGTKYSIILPDETYVISKNFTGLESEKLHSCINITELPMGYHEILPFFAKRYTS